MAQRFLFFLLLTFAACTGANCQTGNTDATLKAAFIFNFTKYIEWDNDNDNSFIIGIVGPSGIDAPLTEIAKTSTVKNKNIVIKHFNSPDNIEYCNILFIPKAAPFSLLSILNRTSKGTLTISEEPGLAKLGTAFNFVLQNDRLKFEANLKTIYSANLKVSSQLLKLAIIIDQQ